MVVGLKLMSMTEKHCYIGVSDVTTPVSKLRKIKAYMERAFDGWTISCWTDHDVKNIRLATFFGFKPTELTESFTVYKREF